MIDPAKIQELLLQDESPTLEFKGEMFQIYDGGTTGERQWDELIKDVLSLANGCASTAGETAYLIIGAENKRSPDGTRDLHDIQGRLPDAEDLRKKVNSACTPPVERIICETVVVDGKHLYVIMIPPSLHLHETTRDLKASKNYLRHIVFMRQNESVEPASAKDREAIAHMKKVRNAEAHSAPPGKLGAAIGVGLLGWAGAVFDKEKYTRDQRVGRAIGGAILGGVAGGLWGRLYKDFVDIRIDWPTMPNWMRVGLFVFVASALLIARILNNEFNKWVKSHGSSAQK